MKKIISLILALMLIVSLPVVAFAAEEPGSITINNVREGNVYEIYKMLDLSLSADGTAFTYTVNPAWEDFFDDGQPSLNYVSINAAGAVTWNTTDDDATKAAFAKLALKWAASNHIQPVKSSTNTGDFVITGTTGKFTGLELGYYLVDSTMGALCGLTTTSPNGTIDAKNGAPTVDKQVCEDSTTQWGAHSTADIGQIVDYRVTIYVHAGAQNYVLHDTMEDGLTFLGVTEIQHVPSTTNTPHTTPTEYYTVKTNGITDGCDFEIAFDQDDFCDKLETNDKVIVHYQAKLNENAEIYTTSENSANDNTNTAWLTFGEHGDDQDPHESNRDTVSTSTFAIDIVKTDYDKKMLNGAQFKIYGSENGDDEIYVKLNDTGDGYIRAADATSGDEIVVANGKICVEGLDNGTYYLEETKEPDGYNKLTARQKFIIGDSNLYASFDSEGKYQSSGVQVVNNTGTMLPETGGLGTLLFTVLGGGAALSTGVVLVTKKRMSKIEDED